MPRAAAAPRKASRPQESSRIADRFQKGISIGPRTRPLPCYRLLVLDADGHAGGFHVRAGLERVLAVLRQLARGHVRELEGQPRQHARATKEQFGSLQAVIGYGRRLFDHDPALTAARRPDFLSYLNRGNSAFPSLPWAPEAERRDAEGDFALQLTAANEAAVNCAAVEVWKAIADERLPLRARESFSGFGRHDGRGWLEFHDGVSNLPADQRAGALAAAGDPPWMEGGTYMAFLRLRIDLATWRARSRDEQEFAVGRDKLSGAALVDVRHDGDEAPVPVAAAAPDRKSTPEERADWRDPPQSTLPLLEGSHIHRANQSRASPEAPGAFRIFRQGYDYLEAITTEGPRVGLNFVSFQRDLRIVQHLLHLPGWLGDSNFGGEVPAFISLQAGGFYAVPRRRRPFPGADLFPTKARRRRGNPARAKPRGRGSREQRG